MRAANCVVNWSSDVPARPGGVGEDLTHDPSADLAVVRELALDQRDRAVTCDADEVDGTDPWDGELRDRRRVAAARDEARRRSEQVAQGCFVSVVLQRDLDPLVSVSTKDHGAPSPNVDAVRHPVQFSRDLLARQAVRFHPSRRRSPRCDRHSAGSIFSGSWTVLVRRETVGVEQLRDRRRQLA